MDQKSPLKVRENKGPTHTLTVMGCLQTGPQVLDSGSNAVLSHHPDSLSPGLSADEGGAGLRWYQGMRPHREMQSPGKDPSLCLR